MAQSSKAIDIEIKTSPDFRKKKLGTVVGAKLVSYCLENKIEPRWLAANPVSEKLAMKLGYIRGESYDTYEIQ
jgi:RimJ/RimL family protein N-acetyltransferase